MTSLGSLGVSIAFAPLIPYARVPILITVGGVQDKPVAVNGEVKVRPILPVGVTFDHRFMDGVHAAHMNRIFRQCFENPEKYFA